jgi:hypothetical protein
MAGQGSCGGGGCLFGSRPLPEQVPPARPAAARAGMAVAAGHTVFLRAGGLRAGGLALVDQVVAVSRRDSRSPRRASLPRREERRVPASSRLSPNRPTAREGRPPP